jgi:carbonic anhydrase/acetyltransferase-like protein (isoleucine patch superfamily)
MAIYELDGVAPRVAASAWVADTAQVMGNVVLGENASVWFGTVVRGDTEASPSARAPISRTPACCTPTSASRWWSVSA